MASNTVTDAKAKVGEAADKAIEHGKDLASEAAAKARDVAGSLADAGRTAASGLADASRSAARSAGQAADSATSRAGEKVESLAGTVREYGPHSGVMGSATETVAHGLERGGQYLQDQGLSGLSHDLTEMVKRNPIPALLFGIGLGFVLARLTSSRS
jgi:hypothetical protein